METAPHTTLSQLFTNFVRQLRLRFRIRSETDLTSNIARHCCIMSVGLELVLNNFINSLVWTKSSDRLSATLSGQTSRPYNNTILTCQAEFARMQYLKKNIQKKFPGQKEGNPSQHNIPAISWWLSTLIANCPMPL